MEFENILFEVEGKIAKITINRPQFLNALNKKTFEDLEEAMKEVYNNFDVKGVIITGSGEKSFVAGADIKEFSDFTPAQGEELSANGQRIFKIIEDSPKPVIAAINGFALGGGLELAMSCHLRIASNNARFGQPEVGLGVTPGYAGTQRLTQLVGKGKAIEMLITGDMIKADAALILGLINHVTTPEELMQKAEGLMNKINFMSPTAVASSIRCVNAYFTEGVDGFKTEAKEFGQCFSTEDFKEGTTAFLEKRKPSFPGK
jgi:enoyl-CoA hydratase